MKFSALTPTDTIKVLRTRNASQRQYNLIKKIQQLSIASNEGTVRVIVFFIFEEAYLILARDDIPHNYPLLLAPLAVKASIFG